MKCSSLLSGLQTPLTAIVCTMLYLGLSGMNARAQNPGARLIRYEVQPEFQVTFRQAVNDYVVTSLQAETNVLSEAYYEQTDTTVL